MDVYGLTGGIGSGKSTVASLLEDYGIPVVSADELSRIVVAKGSEGLHDVVDLFGDDVLDDKGELDRRKMAAIVFQEPGKRKELEAILHPRIRERFEQVLDALEKAGHEVAVYEVPLLFEKNLQGEMKAVLLVTADEQVRIRRVKARDDVTETEVRARIAAQMDEALKRKKADYIVENNGSMDDLRREVEFLLARFLRLSALPEDEEILDRVTEVPIKTGRTLPRLEAPAQPATAPSAAPPADDEISRVKTLIPGGAGGPVPPPGAGVPKINPNAVRSESVPIPVAPTAPPAFGRPEPPPAEPPRTKPAPAKPAPAKPARPSDIETPVPTSRKRDTAIPVRSGETVIGPLPSGPPPPGEPASNKKTAGKKPKSPTQPGRERKTVVATHVPHPPAPAAPTTPNVPPVPTPLPQGDSAPPPAPAGPAAPGPTAQLRRGSVPPQAPAPASAAPKPVPPASSVPPPVPASTNTPPPPPNAVVPRSESQPPTVPVTAASQPLPGAQRPRTQTVRVNALTADDLARSEADDGDDADDESD